MKPHEFVIWLRGFVQASNTYNITPKQWDTICEELEKVKEPTSAGTYTVSVGTGDTYNTTTTAKRRGDVSYKQDELTTDTVF